MYFQLGIWVNVAILKNGVRGLVAASNIKILTKAIGAILVYQLPLKLLVIDAADRPSRRVELHLVICALKRCALLRLGDWSDLLRLPHRINLVARGRDIFCPEANVLGIASIREHFVGNWLICECVDNFVTLIQIN